MVRELPFAPLWAPMLMSSPVPDAMVLYAPRSAGSACHSMKITRPELTNGAEYSHACSFSRPLRRRGRKPRSRSFAADASQGGSDSSASDEVPNIEPAGIQQSLSEAGSRRTDHSLPTQARWVPAPRSSHAFARAPVQDGTSTRKSYRYLCLVPLISELDGFVDIEMANSLLDHYFLRPNVALFNAASPYVLDPVLRKASLQRPSGPREVLPLLTLTMLWVSAQTACLSSLLIPRNRKRICDRLEALILGEMGQTPSMKGSSSYSEPLPSLATAAFEPLILACFTRRTHVPAVDTVLACLLIAIVISGGDSKRDTVPWYHATVNLARQLNLHQLDADVRKDGQPGQTDDFDFQEGQEEKRRLFWLLFSIDRHWSLCYNSMPLILDQDCKIFVPLPSQVWEASGLNLADLVAERLHGPSQSITGLDFFQWFLPLMTILGDIIWVRRQQTHPRIHYGVNDHLYSEIERILHQCFDDIAALDSHEPTSPISANENHYLHRNRASGTWPSDTSWIDLRSTREAQEREKAAMKLYVMFVIHVLFVLLHGRWDALDLLMREDQYHPSSASTGIHNENSRNNANYFRTPLSDWITSEQFTKCSSHAISASEVLAQILTLDPELSLIPYLFGIYLLQGSFVLLFFADRMLEVARSPNPSVEAACETVIRAHEASFATLSVEFQRDFRKVLRRTLSSVRNAQGPERGFMRPDHNVVGLGLARSLDSGQRGASTSSMELGIWREILGLYRWTPGSSGLAI